MPPIKMEAPDALRKGPVAQSDHVKAKTLGFFRGCDFPRCIHAGCPNFIGQSDYGRLRPASEENVREVVGLLEAFKLDVECAVSENPLPKLPEAYQALPVLFGWSFNRLLNASSAERLAYFADLEAELQAKFVPEELEFRMTALLYFEEFLKGEIRAFVDLLTQKVRDFDLFETLLVFFWTFEPLFDYEVFTEKLSLHSVYHAADFPALCPESQVDRLRQSPLFALLTRSRVSRFTENLQNLLTLCYPFNEYLTVAGSLRKFSLTVLCRAVHFLLHCNTLLPRSQRLPLKEFTNPTLSEDYSDKKAVLGFVKGHPHHPLQPILDHMLLEEDSPNEINFMEYPFLFTVDRRVDVLNLESDLFQKMEMFGGANQNIIQLLMGGGLFLSIKLRRANLLEDALSQLSTPQNRANLRKKLKITFAGEPGVDEGGVKKEFFGLLTEQLFDPNFGMFVVKNDRFLWFNHASFECNLNFELVGTLLGLALYNEVILNLKFPLAVYKKLIAAGTKPPLLSDHLDLDDLQEFDPDVHRTLHNLLTKDWTDRETGLTFSVSHEIFGEVKEYELLPAGSALPVTEANKNDFVAKYLDWYFNLSIKNQFASFATGFFRVLLKDSFTLFNAEDLLLALCGSTTLDFHQLKKTASYENYTADSETICFFWSILLDDFTDDQRREFLKFLTGSDRAPIRGLGDIRMIVTKTGDSNSLPSAHTCFNHLILPDYRDYDKLKSKLLKAIENSEGFGLF